VLEAASTKVAVERSSRKDPLTDQEVRDLLARVSTVTLARGKKVETRAASSVTPDDLRGPTGNFRAPMILKGRTLVVGFNAEALRELL
jgi:arsenate reductase-like glutaredoxin family protein